MTYKELLDELSGLSEDRLNDNVCVHMTDDDEYYQIASIAYAVEAECSMLDPGHVVLAAAL